MELKSIHKGGQERSNMWKYEIERASLSTVSLFKHKRMILKGPDNNYKYGHKAEERDSCTSSLKAPGKDNDSDRNSYMMDEEL